MFSVYEFLSYRLQHVFGVTVHPRVQVLILYVPDVNVRLVQRLKSE